LNYLSRLALNHDPLISQVAKSIKCEHWHLALESFVVFLATNHVEYLIFWICLVASLWCYYMMVVVVVLLVMFGSPRV
jgi:hypothetical protein